MELTDWVNMAFGVYNKGPRGYTRALSPTMLSHAEYRYELVRNKLAMAGAQFNGEDVYWLLSIEHTQDWNAQDKKDEIGLQAFILRAMQRMEKLEEQVEKSRALYTN